MFQTTIPACATDELTADAFSAEYCRGFAAGMCSSPGVLRPLVSLEAAGAALDVTERFLEDYLNAWASQGAPEIIHLKMPEATRSNQKLADSNELVDWFLALKRRGLTIVDEPPDDPEPDVPFGLRSPSAQRRSSRSR